VSTTPSNPQPLFAEPPAERGFPTSAVAIATVAVLLLVGLVVVLTRRPAAPQSEAQQGAAYGPHLVFSDIEMSESESLSGGKSTYIDGKITNNGASTVTGISVHVAFRNDVAMPPQVMIAPLTLIRTHEPYVDTQPVSAAPLGPGDQREFRLIFENVNSNWNQQAPDIHISGLVTR
jgi:hypothetical protein